MQGRQEQGGRHRRDEGLFIKLVNCFMGYISAAPVRLPPLVYRRLRCRLAGCRADGETETELALCKKEC